MKKKWIIIASISLIVILLIEYRILWWGIYTDDACTMEDGLYNQNLIGSWLEKYGYRYIIPQFYTYNHVLYYPLEEKQTKWREETRNTLHYFYSYHCQTATLTNLDPDSNGLFEIKILQADSGNMLIQHDDVNNPYQVWFHINEDGSIEKRESSI